MIAATSVAGSVKIADMEQGLEFTKCINNTDLQTKTLDDDITLIDRRVDGCCPAGSSPGVKYYNNYRGAQIVCGMKDDGTVALSTGSSNNVKTCTYNKCYVMKQNIPCKDGTPSNSMIGYVIGFETECNKEPKQAEKASHTRLL